MSQQTSLITYAELCELEGNESASGRSREVARLFIEACDDWPVFNLQEPSALLDELRKEVIGPLTFENLRNYNDRLFVDSDAWKMTALVSLIEIFHLPTAGHFLNDVPLEVVLEGLRRQRL